MIVGIVMSMKIRPKTEFKWLPDEKKRLFDEYTMLQEYPPWNLHSPLKSPSFLENTIK